MGYIVSRSITVSIFAIAMIFFYTALLEKGYKVSTISSARAIIDPAKTYLDWKLIEQRSVNCVIMGRAVYRVSSPVSYRNDRDLIGSRRPLYDY